MSFTSIIQSSAIKSLSELYQQEFSTKDFQVNETKPEFKGDYTIVLFALVKTLKKSPEVLGNELGGLFLKNYPELFSSYNVIKGFLNLEIADKPLATLLLEHYEDEKFGRKKSDNFSSGKKVEKVMVEYASPNTNKPLHLGHLRNIFLGWSVAEILKANGDEVIKTSIVNDRGIHICKSMIAWHDFANGATPETAHEKGDHFVGDYYVKFNTEYKKQVKELTDKGIDEKEAEKEAPIMKKTQQMLLDWEQGKPEVIELWNKMNGWVYKGFDATFKRIGSDFDKTFYESQTYILGKEFVRKGFEDGAFYKKED